MKDVTKENIKVSGKKKLLKDLERGRKKEPKVKALTLGMDRISPHLKKRDCFFT